MFSSMFSSMFSRGTATTTLFPLLYRGLLLNPFNRYLTSTLYLNTLFCHKQQEKGHDEIRLEVWGDKPKYWKSKEWSMRTGRTQEVDKYVTFKNNARIRLQEEDLNWLGIMDTPDYLGELTVDEKPVTNQDHVFAKEGAKYVLRYSVEPT